MIEIANKEQLEEIMQLLHTDVDNNFFFIGDIEQFGINSNIHKTLIKTIDNKIKTVLIVFNQTLLFYDPEFRLSWEEIESLINEYKISNINLSEKMFEHFRFNFESISRFTIHAQTLAKLDKKINIDSSIVQKATIDDIPHIVWSRLKIAEFSSFSQSYQAEFQSYLHSFKSGVLNPFIIKNEIDGVISCATIGINAGKISVIGGIFTLEKYRNQGLAKQVTGALANWIMDQNRTPVLFYHNPVAGQIYTQLGFEPIGKVYTVVLKENHV
ncbi:acetyltransferase [Mycoplasmopsis californica]|uniref:Acetyltransferase n=1 Tax=Mycoplasmopsis californica TaxID=2113 RepID=A0A059XW65_9BACT|nr:GNAT family N-acetyltransferase [Mycoplasmopsis californica]AIA29571.1 acetyltransferase [Mycoplasmopsis californica]